MQGEVFNYDAVNKAMNQDIAEAKNLAKAALNEGTECINTAFGSNGTAMAGLGGTSMQNAWNNMSTEFDAFVTTINTLIDRVNQAGVNNVKLEDIASSIGGIQ